jgi:hypothetical protein
MTNTPLEPWTNAMRLGESSELRSHRYSDRFSVVRVETTGPLADAIRKSSSVPALLLSIRETLARAQREITHVCGLDARAGLRPGCS